jgi:hypothetical protein
MSEYSTQSHAQNFEINCFLISYNVIGIGLNVPPGKIECTFKLKTI